MKQYARRPRDDRLSQQNFVLVILPSPNSSKNELGIIISITGLIHNFDTGNLVNPLKSRTFAAGKISGNEGIYPTASPVAMD